MSFFVYDEIHAELQGEFATFEEALQAIRAWAKLPWDAEPNRAPCQQWRTCGRNYEIREYHAAATDELIANTEICEIRASGVVWAVEPDQDST